MGLPQSYIIELAWCAGIIDGEGSIVLIRHPAHRGTATHYFSPRICVEIREQVAVEVLYRLFGGHIAFASKKNKKHCSTYKWTVGHRQALAAATELLPFLRLKTKQAKLIIEYYNLPRGYKTGTPPKLVTDRNAIYEKMRDLNQKGPDNVVDHE